MKYSIYNSILPLTKKSSMIYNASSDKFLIFNKELEVLLKQSPEKMEQHASDFFNKLKDNGFIVASETDEVADMIALGMNYCNNDSTYRLIINPTTNCNFRCWYCYENHTSGTKMTPETVAKLKKLIKGIIYDKKINHLDVSFFGGEPLLYYTDTVELIIDGLRAERRNNAKFTYNLQFTSNGFLINEHVIKHLTAENEHISFQITLDGGREQHNKVRFSTSGKGSYDRIVENIKKLLSNGIFVGLRINYTKENICSVKSILEDFGNIPEEDANYLSVDFQKVWQDTSIDNNDTVLVETVDAFRKRFKHVYNHYSHADGFRNPCYADLRNECVVNFNGDVYKCTARDFTRENRLGELDNDGTIKWDDPQFVKRRVCEKFNKSVCNKCRIFPICGGGCIQKTLEFDSEYCIKYKSELEIDKVILMRFYNNVVRKQT